MTGRALGTPRCPRETPPLRTSWEGPNAGMWGLVGGVPTHLEAPFRSSF